MRSAIARREGAGATKPAASGPLPEAGEYWHDAKRMAYVDNTVILGDQRRWLIEENRKDGSDNLTVALDYFGGMVRVERG